MAGYRDELEALRLRTQSLEATLREREAALQARDAQLRESEARAERNLRAGGTFNEPPAVPKRSSAMVFVVGLGAVLLVMGGIFAVVTVRSSEPRTSTLDAGEVAELHELAKIAAEKERRAEEARRACEGKLSEAEDRITKLKLEAELARAREETSAP